MSATILIVDDDREVQRYLTDLLEAEGFIVVAEKDGDWALRVFEQKKIDAVVLDILLPVVNGFQVAEQIRAHPRGRTLPIIMVTGIYRGGAHRAEAVRRYGLVDYLDKPVEGSKLVARLHEALAQAPVAGEEPAESADDAAPPDDPLVDEAQRKEKREVERAARRLEEDAAGAALRGNLRRLPFPRLLHRLYRRRATGALFLLRNRVKKIVYFKEGHPTYIKSNVLGECLGQLLVRERLISREECEESLRRMKNESRQQGAVLIGMGVISPHNLKYGLELQLQVKLYDVFNWLEGEYQLRDDVKMPTEAISLEMSNAQIILEGIKRLRDRLRVTAQLEPLLAARAQQARDPAVRFQEMGLEPEEQAFLEAIEGGHAIGEHIDRSPLGRERAETLAYAMLCAGMIEVDEVPTKRQPRPAPPPLGSPDLAVDTDRLTSATPPAEPIPALELSRERLAASLLTMRAQDHFTALGVAFDVMQTELERAYEERAKTYHPDRFRGRGADTRKIAAELFERVTEARRVLLDPDARNQYAAALRDQGAPAPGDPAGRALASDRYFRSGEELLAKRQYNYAADAFRHACELSAESSEYRAYLGWALFLQDPAQEERALAELSEAVRLNPKLARAYLFRGYLHRDAGRLKAAESEFERAIQCNPDCQEAVDELRRLQGG
jgi:DNA-binding response OmpR family regulator/tetratricopeptide (TPR) repeat protein